MDKISKEINEILAEWDPIGVGKGIALAEYEGYIPMIFYYIQDERKLMKYLEELLVKDMGLNYDPNNKKHHDDLQKICDKLMQAYRNWKK